MDRNRINLGIPGSLLSVVGFCNTLSGMTLPLSAMELLRHRKYVFV